MRPARGEPSLGVRYWFFVVMRWWDSLRAFVCLCVCLRVSYMILLLSVGVFSHVFAVFENVCMYMCVSAYVHTMNAGMHAYASMCMYIDAYMNFAYTSKNVRIRFMYV